MLGSGVPSHPLHKDSHKAQGDGEGTSRTGLDFDVDDLAGHGRSHGAVVGRVGLLARSLCRLGARRVGRGRVHDFNHARHAVRLKEYLPAAEMIQILHPFCALLAGYLRHQHSLTGAFNWGKDSAQAQRALRTEWHGGQSKSAALLECPASGSKPRQTAAAALHV